MNRAMGLNGLRWLAGVIATMMCLLLLGGQVALAEHYARVSGNAGLIAAEAPRARKNSAAAATLAGCRVVKPASLERPVS